jgi:hypothetical protein
MELDLLLIVARDDQYLFCSRVTVTAATRQSSYSGAFSLRAQPRISAIFNKMHSTRMFTLIQINSDLAANHTKYSEAACECYAVEASVAAANATWHPPERYPELLHQYRHQTFYLQSCRF